MGGFNDMKAKAATQDAHKPATPSVGETQAECETAVKADQAHGTVSKKIDPAAYCRKNMNSLGA